MQKTVQSVPSYKSYFHPTKIEIDLQQFKKNIQQIRGYIGDALYCLPIKANAYGHGLCEIGHAAQEAGVEYLAVSSLIEGVKLRNHGIRVSILVLGPLYEESILDYIDYDLEFSISSLYKARQAQEKLFKTSKVAQVHLEVETGMNRTGSRPKRSESILQFIEKSPNLKLKGIYSHFANSDQLHHPSNQAQLERFLAFTKPHEKSVLVHMANSGALVNFKSSFQKMVRPGLLSFGLYQGSIPKELSALQSVFTLKSQISYFKVIDLQEGVSYGHTYKATTKTRVATIPIGYGDGYSRLLSNCGEVLIRGKRYPVIGTICMDQLMVELGEDEGYVGDEVVLIGKQGRDEITLFEVASKCQTIPYEILTGFNERVPRIYL